MFYLFGSEAEKKSKIDFEKRKKGKIDFGKTQLSGTFCAIFPCKMHQNEAKMNNIGYFLKIFAFRAGLLLE